MSVNWGPWAKVGMVASLDNREHIRWAEMGIGLIQPEKGLSALEMALRQDATQLAVLPIDWKTWQRAYPAFSSKPFFRDLINSTDASPRIRPFV